MFLTKLSKKQRLCLREQRIENQLIATRIRNRDFEYVVNPPDKPRVVFGTGLERVTLPMSGPSMTPFMRQIQGEIRDYPGPFEYDTSVSLEKEYPSNLGFSALISKQPRLPKINESNYPPIGAYDVDFKRSMKQSLKPFGVGVERMKGEQFLTPGPPTYPYHIPKKKLNILTAFGSRRIIWPTVAVFCSPVNSSKCYKCSQTPYGDYWHNFASNLDMCRPCMKKECNILKNCATNIFHRIRMYRELDRFKPARYCGFYHDHHGTTAAIPLISSKTLRFKIFKENYLYLYQ